MERRRRVESALVSVVATSYLLGVSTRRMEKLVEQLGITRLSKSQVSEMAKDLDGQVEAFRTRPLDAGRSSSAAGSQCGCCPTSGAHGSGPWQVCPSRCSHRASEPSSCGDIDGVQPEATAPRTNRRFSALGCLSRNVRSCRESRTSLKPSHRANVQWQQAAVRMGGKFQGHAHGSAVVTCCPIAWSRWLGCTAPW